MFSNQEVLELSKLFKGILVRTPCVLSPNLSDMTGAKVYLKLENMQKTGSFKERGALSFLLRKDRLLNHVVTASAGNHAQAVALHSARLGIPATIFMPKGTPNTKVLATERLLASVQLVGQNYDEAFLAARQFADSFNAQYIHAYNDPDVILGQATIALEIIEEVSEPDVIFVPVGGGGLISGIAEFMAQARPAPKTKIIGVEASDFQSMAVALNKGRKSIDSDAKTIAEGIAVRRVGALTEEICRKRRPELIAVNDDEIQSAIMLSLERQKIVAEGAGAAPIAALLHKEFRHSFKDQTVILIISGGNIDISLLKRLTAQELVNTGRLCRMSIVIKDTPGSLSALLQTMTRARANIVDIRHERSFADVRWNEVLVDVTVETKDDVHEEQMLSAILGDGYTIRTHKRG